MGINNSLNSTGANYLLNAADQAKMSEAQKNIGKKQDDGKQTEKKSREDQIKIDLWEKSEHSKEVTSNERLQEMLNESVRVRDEMRKMIESMIGGQVEKGNGGYWDYGGKFGAKLKNFKISEEDRLKAQEAIGEDGYFGVKKTTERIMDFAKVLAGGDADAEKIEMLRDASNKGFENVAKMFGGMDKLPQVSQDTYDAVNKAFDDWKSSLGTPEEAMEEKTEYEISAQAKR
jgi:hypothetical protein